MNTHFNYLCELQMSGEPNMLGATPSLQRRFGMSKIEARKILIDWMAWMQKTAEHQGKSTPLGKTYWNYEGAYQKEHDELYKKLVPSCAEAETIHGELIRVANRFYYDYFNNGNCNVIEERFRDCPECEGTGWEYTKSYNSYDDDEDYDEIAEDCSYCGGNCTVHDKYVITEYYEQMLSWISRYMTNDKVLRDFKNWLSEWREDHNFDEKFGYILEQFMDAVMLQVLTTDNAPNPNYKPEKLDLNLKI